MLLNVSWHLVTFLVGTTQKSRLHQHWALPEPHEKISLWNKELHISSVFWDFYLFIYFKFWHRISLCGHVWPRAHHVDQVDFNLCCSAPVFFPHTLRVQLRPTLPISVVQYSEIQCSSPNPDRSFLWQRVSVVGFHCWLLPFLVVVCSMLET